MQTAPIPPAPDVVIVGAGPTGLMAATLLRRFGISVRIFDKTAAQAHESRAFAVHARSLELLRAIGLGDAFMERGLIAAGAQIFVEGAQVGEIDIADIGRDDTPYPFVLMVPQWDIEAILADDLRRQGVTVEHDVEVTDFRQSPSGVVVRATRSDGSRLEVSAAYVVGADGAHSIVRRTLGLRFEGAPYPQGFLLADCRVDWALDHDRLKIFVGDRNLAVFLPLRGREVGRIIAIQPFDEQASNDAPVGSAPATLDEVEAALRGVAKIPVTLRDPLWVTRYRLHHRGVDRYGEGRAFVAGDAAHIHSPAGGQGMNTGLQDAANLAWKLALVIQHRAPAALLATYDSERRPIGQKILQRTDRLFAGMSSQQPWVARVRNVVLPLLAPLITRSARARAIAFHFVSQLGIRYHTSPFVHDAPGIDANAPGLIAPPRTWRHGITAGRRAPDATISAEQRVFDLLDGYRFHLLALSRLPLDGDEIAHLRAELDAFPDLVGLDVGVHLIARSLVGRDARLLQAESPQVFSAYGLSRQVQQALFLIRPDGYVAYRAPNVDVGAIGRFTKERFRGE
ncbi:MAG: FAD-dependent monooxygenase [Candidatus Binatia bacterium]